MTPYQVSSEIYGGFFYSGITLTTLKPAFSNASTNANNMDDASEINKLTSVCHASVLLAIEDTRICAVIDKTKFNRQTQAKAKSSEPSKLFGLEVIWIQCFHWPNTTTCGKYPYACATPISFSHVAARKQDKRKHKKKEKF